MIGVLILLVVVAGCVVWDRQSPVSTAPDDRLIRIGAVLAVVGALSSLLMWWLIVPVVVFLAGAAMVVVGRHRVVVP